MREGIDCLWIQILILTFESCQLGGSAAWRIHRGLTVIKWAAAICLLVALCRDLHGSGSSSSI